VFVMYEHSSTEEVWTKTIAQLKRRSHLDSNRGMTRGGEIKGTMSFGVVEFVSLTKWRGVNTHTHTHTRQNRFRHKNHRMGHQNTQNLLLRGCSSMGTSTDMFLMSLRFSLTHLTHVLKGAGIAQSV
jgi:hypothetical protein